MNLCRDCRFSFIREHGNKRHRCCERIDGNPVCNNARQYFWDYQNRERECGPSGKLFDQKPR